MKKQRSDHSQLVFELVKKFGKNPEALKGAAQTLFDTAHLMENVSKKNKDSVLERAISYYEKGNGDICSCINWANFDVLYENPENHKMRRKKRVEEF